MLMEVDDGKVKGTKVGDGTEVELTEQEAIAAVKMFVDGKVAMAKAGKRRSKRRIIKKAPKAAEVKPVKAKVSKGRRALNSVEFHFTHDFAPKSRMPDHKMYRLLWRPIAEVDPESIEDAAVREVAMEEDAQRPFVVIANATGKIRHNYHDVVVKLPRSVVAAGYAWCRVCARCIDGVSLTVMLPVCREYTLGLTVRRDECSCSQCLGNDEVDSCETCGCTVCIRKDDAEKMIVCDECGKNYHYYCLSSVVRTQSTRAAGVVLRRGNACPSLYDDLVNGGTTQEGSHITIDSEGKDVERQGNLSDADFAELVNSENEIAYVPSCLRIVECITKRCWVRGSLCG